MTRLYATIALSFALFATGPVIAGETETLVHDGITYEYSVIPTARGRIIDGYDQTNRRAFRLEVARGRVVGTVDGSPVSFRLRDVKPVTGAVPVRAPAAIATR